MLRIERHLDEDWAPKGRLKTVLGGKFRFFSTVYNDFTASFATDMLQSDSGVRIHGLGGREQRFNNDLSMTLFVISAAFAKARSPNVNLYLNLLSLQDKKRERHKST